MEDGHGVRYNLESDLGLCTYVWVEPLTLYSTAHVTATLDSPSLLSALAHSPNALSWHIQQPVTQRSLHANQPSSIHPQSSQPLTLPSSALRASPLCLSPSAIPRPLSHSPLPTQPPLQPHSLPIVAHPQMAICPSSRPPSTKDRDSRSFAPRICEWD